MQLNHKKLISRSLIPTILIIITSTNHPGKYVKKIEDYLLTVPPKVNQAKKYIDELEKIYPNHPVACFWKMFIACQYSQWDSALLLLNKCEESFSYITHKSFYLEALEYLPYIKGVLLLVSNMPEQAHHNFSGFLQYLRTAKMENIRVHPLVYRLFDTYYTSEQLLGYLLEVRNIQDIVTLRIEETYLLEWATKNLVRSNITVQTLSTLNTDQWEYGFLADSLNLSIQNLTGYFTYRAYGIHEGNIEPLGWEQIRMVKNGTIHHVNIQPAFSRHVSLTYWRAGTGILYRSLQGGEFVTVTKGKFDTLLEIKGQLMPPQRLPYRQRTAIFLDSSGSVIMFVSDRPGGVGQLDLWIAYRDRKNRKWSIHNAGYTINTPKNELTPFTAQDTILIFASEGLPHIGMSDLYFTFYRLEKDTVRGVIRVVFSDTIFWFMPPINSPAREVFPAIYRYANDDSLILIWNSDRSGGKGGLDFYFSILPHEMAEQVSIALPLSKLSIPVDSLAEVLAIKLARETKYAYYSPLDTAFKGLDKYLQTFNEKGLDKEIIPQEWIRHDSCLLLGTVHFPFAQDTILPGYKRKLEELTDKLKSKELIRIRIVGHTDDIGSSQYNYWLGLRRARSVATFFTGQGIPADQVLISSEGERHPIASNDTDEGRALNRRAEIIVCPSDIAKSYQDQTQ